MEIPQCRRNGRWGFVVDTGGYLFSAATAAIPKPALVCMRKRRRLSVEVDVFNLTNQTRATAVGTLVGAKLGEPATLNFPLNARLGVSLSWGTDP